MYHYIEDQMFKKMLREVGSDIVKRTIEIINESGCLKVSQKLVGSARRNMITQNGNGPVDLDFDVVIEKAMDINDCHKIKETVRLAFDKALGEFNLRPSSDSTSALTASNIHFEEGNKTPWGIDLAIVYVEGVNHYRLIHDKVHPSHHEDAWIWNPAPNSNVAEQKAKEIKAMARWNGVRKAYLNKKNFYFASNEEEAHPSYICYIEAVNEVYVALNGQKKPAK